VSTPHGGATTRHAKDQTMNDPKTDSPATDGRAPREVFVTMMRDYFGIAYPPSGAGSATPTVEDVFAQTLLDALEEAYETGFTDGERSVA
jgi:hypothetical protein